MTTQTPDYDILIIGGGMAGASLACALGGLPLKVAMVEAVPFEAEDHPGYDDRVIALAQVAKPIFEGLGVWRDLAPGATPIRTIHVSERGRLGSALLEAEKEGVEALGYVAEARLLGQALHAGLGRLENLELLCPARLTDLHNGNDAAVATIETGGAVRTLGARLVVAVDGTHSPVRDRILRLPTRVDPYGQTAIIANVTPERPHRNVAFERFTDSGPLAVLPMTLGRCAVVWTNRSERAEELLALDDDAFLAALQERFGHRLGRLLKVGRRAAYPLALTVVEQPVLGRTLLLSNAAHTLHPIAGQGFNLGLRDVVVLAELVAEALARGEDLGGAGLLGRYLDQRLPDQRRVIGFSDGLLKLFSNPFAPLSHARSLGLIAFDLAPPLKHLFARQNMGLLGRLPRLARGLGLPL